jgi:chemotaxis protein methyltransferase CheR
MSVLPTSHSPSEVESAVPNGRAAALLEAGLGLAPTGDALNAFVAQCRHRAAGLGLSEDAYYELLAAGGSSARSEWIAMSPALTVGETFLFRDAGLWKLMERTLLPGIARLTQPVWLWSAGCSTGEEAYTLAIVARRALGATAFCVLGTDINPNAIAAARVGVYTPWSLRGIGANRVEELVVSGTQTLRVRGDVRKLVRFAVHNLLDEQTYPPAGMASFECIVCRNVLIYMTPAARAAVIERLAASLAPGGVLVLGHGEAQGVPVGPLVVERHDAGVVYRKPLPAAAQVREPPRIERRPSVRRIGVRDADRGRAESLGRRATKTAQSRAAQTADALTGLDLCHRLLALAAQQARAGHTETAERNAALASATNPLAPEPYVLLAALYAARDAFKPAESALRRALFLDPACIPALWQLGTLYRLTNRNRQAAVTFARLLARLDGLPPEQVALPFDQLTVEELQALLRAALEQQRD